MADTSRFAVRFDAEALAEDRHHAGTAGRAVLQRERGRLERVGLAAGELRASQAHGRDGTMLAGRVKTYLPASDGP